MSKCAFFPPGLNAHFFCPEWQYFESAVVDGLVFFGDATSALSFGYKSGGIPNYLISKLSVESSDRRFIFSDYLKGISEGFQHHG
jgi:hypothetical protein